MPLRRYIADLSRRFICDCRGAIAIIFAVTIMVLMMAVGGAVDFATAYSSKSHLQSAIDAAAIAAARVGKDQPTLQYDQGLAVFKSNYPKHARVAFDLKVINDAVHISATHQRETAILRVVGIDRLDVAATVEVPLLKAGKAEVVLVLDYSDSMLDANKYVRMREAALAMIDRITDNGKNTNVKFGVVPFAAMVHVDLPSAYLRSGSAYSGCTQDRRYPYNTQEEAGHAGDPSRWGEVTSTHSCSDMAAANLKTIPLTNDVASVKSAISAMQPHLWTHIALGAEFGWQLLSPVGAFTQAVPYSDKETVKVFVLLTDGMQTAPGWGPGDVQSTSDGEANLKSICSGMKAKNIMVFTVGYDLNDTHTLDLLQSCANSGNFYNATDINNGLMAAFGAIANQVQEAMLRLAK
jgi:Flp pilus assembly protein TadG